LLAFPFAVSPNPATSFLFACLSLELNQWSSSPFHSLPASNLLTIQFAAHPCSDSEFCSIPEAIHFAREVFGELG
jgi:hypothetical protein